MAGEQSWQTLTSAEGELQRCRVLTDGIELESQR